MTTSEQKLDILIEKVNNLQAENASLKKDIMSSLDVAMDKRIEPIAKELSDLRAMCLSLQQQCNSAASQSDTPMDEQGSPVAKRWRSAGSPSIDGGASQAGSLLSTADTAVNPKKIVIKGFPECLARKTIKDFLEENLAGLSAGLSFAATDCEAVAYAFSTSAEATKTVVDRFKDYNRFYVDPAGGRHKLKIQQDRSIDTRRHGLVIGKIRARLATFLPGFTVTSNGYRGKIIATDSANRMMPIMTVSKVARSGAVSYHILDGVATLLSIEQAALVEAAEKGIQDAALLPL